MYSKRSMFIEYHERSFLVFVYGVLGAVAAAAAMFVWTQLVNKTEANAYRAGVRAHLRRETGTVVSRGPYQGDAAWVSYRLVTVKYLGWNGSPQTSERLFPWAAQVGDSLSVTISDNPAIPAYMPEDENVPVGNPWYPATVGVITGWILLGILVSILIGLLDAHLLYRFHIYVRGKTYYARRSRTQTA